MTREPPASHRIKQSPGLVRTEVHEAPWAGNSKGWRPRWVRGCRGLLGVKNRMTWKEWSYLLQCLSLLKSTFVVAMSRPLPFPGS
jgi:hypothetical protein